MGDQPIFSTKAHVFQIDPETKKKWLPVSSQAVTVSFYHDIARNSYRIISFDGTNKAIVNSTILANMSFAKTSQKFGQWSDPRVGTVYGLGFNSEMELTKFMEKFMEVKELAKTSQQGLPASVDVKPLSISNVHSNGTDSASPTSHRALDNVTVKAEVKPELLTDTVFSTASSSASAANSQVIDQLKYDNDRLKMALAQSSTNAKKWEQDMQTLRSNNQRLTTALQESNVNVEEWKKQLAAYKEENSRMKTKLADAEKFGGNMEVLQKQLLDTKVKLEESERLVSQKQEEVNELKRKLDETKQMDAQCQRLTVKIQTMEEEKIKTRQQMNELQSQLEEAQLVRSASKQQLLLAQQQLSTKINELYEMNDKLADLLQAATI